MHQPDIATPAGTKQAYHIHPKAPGHLRWSTRAIRRLVYGYMVTDKGLCTCTTAVGEGDGENRGPAVRMRWMGTPECSTSPALPVGGGQDGTVDVVGTDLAE